MGISYPKECEKPSQIEGKLDFSGKAEVGTRKKNPAKQDIFEDSEMWEGECQPPVPKSADLG
jgi:hypothetical protein